ncbi:Testis associated actin remodelling kinase 2 [Balamuthia mandrillaris]
MSAGRAMSEEEALLQEEAALLEEERRLQEELASGEAELDEAELEWQRQQQQRFGQQQYDGGDDAEEELDEAELAFLAQQKKLEAENTLQGFIENLEKIWEIDFSQLKFLEQIAVGAFGTIRRGQYLGLEVAIKTVFPEDDDDLALMYLDREINVLKAIRHPNVVQFIGISDDSSNNLIHIVTEYMKNGDLRKKLKDPEVKLSWKQKTQIAYELATALAYLHSKNIIHRDLKSKNILVDKDLKVKLCDFGFARTAEYARRPMTLCGTEDWMAPEIIMGEAYSLKADVFSYGIVLIEIITRKKISKELQRGPEEAFSLNEEKFLSLCPPDCPSDLSQAVLECCMPDPDKRPTFEALVEHFEIVLQELDEQEKKEREEKEAMKKERTSALEKFRQQAALLRQGVIEKGTIRARQGLAQQAHERNKNPIVITAPAVLKEKKSRLVRTTANNRVSTIHNLIGQQISNTLPLNGPAPTTVSLPASRSRRARTGPAPVMVPIPGQQADQSQVRAFPPVGVFKMPATSYKPAVAAPPPVGVFKMPATTYQPALMPTGDKSRGKSRIVRPALVPGAPGGTTKPVYPAASARNPSPLPSGATPTFLAASAAAPTPSGGEALPRPYAASAKAPSPNSSKKNFNSPRAHIPLPTPPVRKD